MVKRIPLDVLVGLGVYGFLVVAAGLVISVLSVAFGLNAGAVGLDVGRWLGYTAGNLWLSSTPGAVVALLVILWVPGVLTRLLTRRS